MTYRIVILIASLVAVSCSTVHPHPSCDRVRWNDHFISPKWLVEKTSIETVEQHDLQTGWLFGHQPDASKEWVALKKEKRDGDELWVLNSPSQNGYALLRGCDIVAVVIIIES